MRRWLPLAFWPLLRLIEYGVVFVLCTVMTAVVWMFANMNEELDPKFMLVTDTLALARTVAVHVEPPLDVVLLPTGQEVPAAYPYWRLGEPPEVQL